MYAHLNMCRHVFWLTIWPCWKESVKWMKILRKVLYCSICEIVCQKVQRFEKCFFLCISRFVGMYKNVVNSSCSNSYLKFSVFQHSWISFLIYLNLRDVSHDRFSYRADWKPRDMKKGGRYWNRAALWLSCGSVQRLPRRNWSSGLIYR